MLCSILTLRKLFENKAFFCYTRCVNTRRNVMTTLIGDFFYNAGLAIKRKAYRYTALGLVGMLGFSQLSCDKGEPITPGDGGEPTQPVAKVDSVDSILKVYSTGTSAVMGDAIIQDGKTYYGFNARISDNESKITTGRSGYDNIKYKVKYFRENMKKGTNSIPGGEYYIAADNAKNPIISYEPAQGKYLKNISVTNGNQTTIHRIIRADIFVEGKEGMRIMAYKAKDDAEFSEFLDNATSPESAEMCAKRNILDLDATKKSTLSIISPN